MTRVQRKLRTVQRELSVGAFGLVGLGATFDKPETFPAAFCLIAANAVIQAIRITQNEWETPNGD